MLMLFFYTKISSRKTCVGTSLVVQWLRLHAPNAGGPGFDSELDPAKGK